MSFTFDRRLDPDTAAVRARILNALPAGGYQMDRFFQLLDLELSQAIPSAAVRCGDRPRLLLNPQFVARFCRTDEHLFLLVMHELLHVVLGHTRLFAHLTPAHNIAFDAVINAMLCRQFPSADYVGFFQAINGWQHFPARLLRPAPGWPRNPEALPEDASETERKLHARLYGSDAKDVTYHEIFELLAQCIREAEGQSAPKSAGGSARSAEESGTRAGQPTLIGSHDNPEGEDEAAVDPTLTDVLRRAVAVWPAPFREIGRDRGLPATDRELSSRERADRELELAIERLFQRAGLKEAHRSPRRRREVTNVSVDFGTVVPQLDDRRARVRSALIRSPAVFYEGHRTSPRSIHRMACRAFVYLDISGSMDSVLPRLLAALRGPVRCGAARLFAFSTIIDEVDPRSLNTARAKSTGGTDIDCVLTHVLELPRAQCPKRVVVLTDGWVGPAHKALRKEFAARRIELIAGLTAPWYATDVAPLASHIEQLPEPDGARAPRTGPGRKGAGAKGRARKAPPDMRM